MLKQFKINTDRDLLVPSVEFYQMGLEGPVEYALSQGEFKDELPSWSKFIANPIKAKGFFTNVLQSLFLGQHGNDELNVDLQTESYNVQKSRVAMMFMPGNARKDALQMVEAIASQTLTGFVVINISGGSSYNGTRITNSNAERITKEVVQKAKDSNSSVLIIAAQMAQRSYSVPEITELYLAYDQGQEGATIQKMSRTLTPDDMAKIGRVFSLSFDPNRDDKFDSILIETVVNYHNTHQMKSAKEAMRDVLRTIDIFKCDTNGALKINGDEYLEDAMARKSISRVIGKISNFGKLTQEEITALATGNSSYFRAAKSAAAQKGKTRNTASKKRANSTVNDNTAAKELGKAREVIVTIVENIDFLVYGSEAETVQEAIEIINLNPEMQVAVQEEFGVCFETVQYLFTNNVINQNLLELMHDK